ncbi:hypothetical protein P256_00682 [Acinetobacter nectaris CIP 110549]|uniref:Pectate lyase superfamily protein domain-containing protein n=1 Tax=Acinetobacter nectaris CIP 110549 TaxID=1392540 RepID=V2TVB4_9GAMM|nr:hypothetical protein [Acinetobacter nectaris]ESK40235.1 hypothetical protein P256_00682 [Acinetobacter nectaris CIP 110549]
MATNWNTILSNTKNLNDVLAILRKILGQTDKLSELDIDGILANIDSQVNQATSNFDSKQVDALNQLKETLEVAKAAGAGANGWITDIVATKITDAQTQDLFNQKGVTTVESVADLAGLDAWEGRTVSVKGYYKPTSSLPTYRGGGTFTYRSALSNQNDNVTIINGWALHLDSHNTINAYQAGAYGDGVTDDQPYIERCLQAIYKLGFGEVQLTNGKFLVNRQMASSYNKSYPSIIELASNMNFMVDKTATLIVGSNFDYNKPNAPHLILFGLHSDANKTWVGGGSDVEATAVDNVSIYGGGTIDFTQSGNMGTTAYQTRYALLMVRSSNILIDGLTFVGNATNGDLTNAIGNLTNKIYGDNVVVSNCTFKNLVCNSTINTDHSSVYILATNAIGYNNNFISDQTVCPKMSLIGSVWEAHNFGHKLYNNYVSGYKNSMIVAFETREHYDPSGQKGGIHFYDNKIHTMCNFIQFDMAQEFTNIKPILIHDNEFTSCRYLTSNEQGMTWYNKQSSRLWFNVYNANTQTTQASSELIAIYNNIIAEDPTNYDYSFSSNFSTGSTSCLIGISDNSFVPKNLTFRDNLKIQVYSIANFSTLNSARNIVEGFNFKESKVDMSMFTTTKTPFDFHTRYMDNADINITLDNFNMFKLSWDTPLVNVGFDWGDAGTSSSFVLNITRGLNGILYPMAFDSKQVARQNFFNYPSLMRITATAISTSMNLVKYMNTQVSNTNYNSYIPGITDAKVAYNNGDDIKNGLATPSLSRTGNNGELSGIGTCTTIPSSPITYDIFMQLSNNNI